MQRQIAKHRVLSGHWILLDHAYCYSLIWFRFRVRAKRGTGQHAPWPVELSRTLENLKDAVDRTIGSPDARSDRDDTVHPVVFLGTGFKNRVHAEVIASGVDFLAHLEFLDDTWRTGTQTGVGHHDQFSIRCLEYKPDIQLDA